MKYPKPFFVLFIIMELYAGSAFAQDTTKKAAPAEQIFSGLETVPVFPGGNQAFSRYIIKNLKYPEVAALIGLTGKVYVKFVIDQYGNITEVAPVKCLGAGCESEAVRVISMSPRWTPGMQDGKAVRVQYTVPINFGFITDNTRTYIKNLRKSDYGFVFYIKGTTYTLDEAEAILGEYFNPATIETVEDNDDPKYAMPDKKAVYLIVMKNS